jgi:hypothetical protein
MAKEVSGFLSKRALADKTMYWLDTNKKYPPYEFKYGQTPLALKDI